MKLDPAKDIPPFDGGKSLMLGFGALGVVGLAVVLGAAVAMGPELQRAALFSYLLAFAYWAGLGLASLVLLQIFHAVRAKWMVVLRRPVEIMASTVVLFLVLFIPIVLGMKEIYSWVAPDTATLTREAQHVLHHKAPYLNTTFFIVRGFFYILLASVVANRLYGLSNKQDGTGGHELTARQRWLGTAALPFVALTFSFAAFDWLMSLEPLWFSTIFGVYYFGGSFLSVLSLLVVVTDRARGAKSLYGELVTTDHIHNIGKLMLAFTCFWGYIGFSQFMLIWVAGLPEETPFFVTRLKGGWAGVGVFLILGHFFIPFGALLSRSLKRNRTRLAWVAFWILMVHFIDLYWLIMPTLDPETPLHGPAIGLSIAALLGVGGLAVAFAIWRIRGKYTVPVRDPYLADSLAYRQP